MKKQFSSMLLIIVMVFTIIAMNASTASAYTVPSNMQWWADSRFGMFIHLGSYSYYGQGEWAMANQNISKQTYQTTISANFNPVNFNATTIVNYAKNAGMKYLVITAKHHEGFAMWNSQVASFKDYTGTTLYNLYNYTPFKNSGRDILMELKNACDAAGIKFGLYYSILDWNHPSQSGYNYTTMSSMTARANYITDMKAQLQELITRYNPAIMWFDGDWTYNSGSPTLSSWWTKSDGADLYNYLKGLSPNIVVNERVCRSFGLGDFDCPEQTIPAAPLSRSWETCATMNGQWGYTSWAENSYRSVGAIIQEMVTAVSREGNYLLNIGPKGDGSMTSGSQTILSGMGSWMNTYSDSIYGTTRNPYGTDPSWGTYTQKGNKVYAHVFTWPTNGTLTVPVLSGAISKIYTLNNPGTSLSYSVSNGNISISVPQTAPDANDSVVVIEYSYIGTAVNNTDSGISYSGSWGYSSNRGLGDYNDDVQFTQTDNDYAQYTFNGTGISYVTETNSDEGNVDVYIDNVYQTTVNCYNSSRLAKQAVYSKTGLTSGTHTIKLVKKSGQYMLVDAFYVSKGVNTPFNGTYKIINKNSGMGLNVPGASTNDGTQLIQSTYGGANNEQWQITPNGDGTYRIINVNSGKAADVLGWSTSDGAAVGQWTYGGGNNQKWNIVDAGGGYYRLVNINSNKVMDVSGSSTSSGAQIVQSTDNGGSSQQWQILAP